MILAVVLQNPGGGCCDGGGAAVLLVMVVVVVVVVMVTIEVVFFIFHRAGDLLAVGRDYSVRGQGPGRIRCCSCGCYHN